MATKTAAERAHYSMHNFVPMAQLDEVEDESSYDDGYHTRVTDEVGLTESDC